MGNCCAKRENKSNSANPPIEKKTKVGKLPTASYGIIEGARCRLSEPVLVLRIMNSLT